MQSLKDYLIDFFASNKLNIRKINIDKEYFKFNLSTVNNIEILASDLFNLSLDRAEELAILNLYAKFCNKTGFNNYLFKKKLQDLKQEKEEQEISNYPEYINTKILELFGNTLSRKEVFKAYYKKEIKDIKPFTSLDGLTTYNYDLNVLRKIYGGLTVAADVDKFSALNSCIEQLLENFAFNWISNISKKEKLVKLDYTVVSDKNIEVWVYDLSFNLNLPILMALIFNKDTNTIKNCFSASFKFNTALKKLENKIANIDYLGTQIPSTVLIRTPEKDIEHKPESDNIIKESIIYNYNYTVLGESFNKKVFIENEEEISQEVLYNNYKELLSPYGLLYTNISLLPNIYCYFFISNLDTCCTSPYTEASPLIFSSCVNTNNNLINLIDEILGEDFNAFIAKKENILSSINNIQGWYNYSDLVLNNLNSSAILDIYKLFDLNENLNPYGNYLRKDNYIIADLLDFSGNTSNIYNTIYYTNAKFIETLRRYKIEHFTLEYMQKLFFWRDPNELEYLYSNLYNGNILFFYLFILPLYTFYYSEEWENFVSIFRKGEELQKELMRGEKEK